MRFKLKSVIALFLLLFQIPSLLLRQPMPVLDQVCPDTLCNQLFSVTPKMSNLMSEVLDVALQQDDKSEGVAIMEKLIPGSKPPNSDGESEKNSDKMRILKNHLRIKQSRDIQTMMMFMRSHSPTKLMMIQMILKVMTRTSSSRTLISVNPWHGTTGEQDLRTSQPQHPSQEPPDQ